MSFPMDVQKGSVIVKIYKVRNKAYTVRTKNNRIRSKARFSFMVAHHAKGKRYQKMFARFDLAFADAENKATTMANGELDALSLDSIASRAYVNAMAVLEPIGVPLEVAAKDYAAAWHVLEGRASLLEAAQEYARRLQHKLPDKTVPEAVAEMLEARKKDGTGDAYLKLLRVHLNQLKENFTSQVRQLTTGQLTDYFRDLDVSPRSKNNARATVGAFLKFCKERGWLTRDHEGVAHVPKFKERPTDIEIYTPTEMAELLRAARGEMMPFLTIGAFAGLRTAEIERLDWAEVNVKELFIEIKAAKAKTASRRLVPISDNLAKWLWRHEQEQGRVWPFDNTAKQIGWLMEDVNEARALAAMQKAAARAGRGDWTAEDLLKAHRARRKPQAEQPDDATATKADAKAAKRKEQTTFLPDGAAVKYHRAVWKKNALRHSYISYRVAETQDVAQVALEAGNSPQIIFQHYRELVRLKEAKEWCAIEPDKHEKAVVVEPKVELKAVAASKVA